MFGVCFMATQFLADFRGLEKVFDEIFDVTVRENKPYFSKVNYSFPYCNIYINKEDDLCIDFALSGYTKEDLKVIIENGNLIVEANKNEDDNIKEYLFRGIKDISFKKIYSIPDKYDYDSILSIFENGILKIKFKLSEGKKPKQIEIK